MRRSIEFPKSVPPAAGQFVEIVPGIFWVRLPLPFQLNHVNVYLIKDGDGFAIVDTGIDSPVLRELWISLLNDAFGGKQITQVIATHYHPDHVGLAGWLTEYLSVPLLMSETEYLKALNIKIDPSSLNPARFRNLYSAHGLDMPTVDRLLVRDRQYCEIVSDLPLTFQRLIAGDTLAIGGRTFEILTGGGHSPEQVMLFCRTENFLIAADHVLPVITPNISVEAMEPEGDPLGIYLRLLSGLLPVIPADVLVLPGHRLPFIGLHTRINELLAHHEDRCDAIVRFCEETPRTIAGLIPEVFGRAIDDPHQMAFAFCETFAHTNYLKRRGRLLETRRNNGTPHFLAGEAR